MEDCTLVVGTPDMEVEMFAKFPKFQALCLILSERLTIKTEIAFDQFKLASPEQQIA